jgi:tRNA-2-methylthio-N6-dimethylallyladenosine synthase
MTHKRLYIETIGCQMNVVDSQRIAGILSPLDYHATPAVETADAVIVNTCAIREKAEQKVFSFLGRLAGLKRKNPDLIIGVGGCVAQQQGERILERMPFVDIVFGTHAVARLPRLIARVEAERCRLVDVAFTGAVEPMDSLPAAADTGGVSRFVTIMQGCDNYCTYCVVPHVRGREASRPPDRILVEIEGLVAVGAREVTLLGQNVNSYGRKEGLCSFAELLGKINAVSGLRRIRFTTSHPKDLSQDLARAFGRLDKLCPHIHLPVQSGSDRILHRMNRGYTCRGYLEKVAMLRDCRPDIALSSDFIVGFPGETAEDFEQTLSLMREVCFDSVFAFKYSDRPDAPAAKFNGKLDETEKNRRLQILLDLQETITRNKHRLLIGSIQDVLVEGPSKKQAAPDGADTGADNGATQWSGRAASNKIVNFGYEAAPPCGEGDLTGRMVRTKIEKAYSHSLLGTLVSIESTPYTRKGDQCYAA